MTRKVKEYYVYILSSRSGTLYVGMTNDDVVRACARVKQIPHCVRNDITFFCCEIPVSESGGACR